jgi:hypothetical protein
LCKTKPNLGGLRYLGPGARGEPIVQNKPNLPPAAPAPAGRLYKQTQFGRANCAKQTQFAAELCETNPIFRLWVADREQTGAKTPPCGLPLRASPGGSYKQSQLAAGLWCETKPISLRGRALRGEGVLYKQTQFTHVARASHAPDQAGPKLCAGADFARGSESWARRPCYCMPIRRSAFPGGQIVRNKPNPGGEIFHYSIIPPFQFDADCAKRTQFAVHTPERCGGLFRLPPRPAAEIMLPQASLALRAWGLRFAVLENER